MRSLTVEVRNHRSEWIPYDRITTGNTKISGLHPDLRALRDHQGAIVSLHSSVSPALVFELGRKLLCRYSQQSVTYGHMRYIVLYATLLRWWRHRVLIVP